MNTFFKGFLINGKTVMVDPNSAKLNGAGTNMTVQVYSEFDFDRGKRMPEEVNFKNLALDDPNFGHLEVIFALKQAKYRKKIRSKQNELRANKKYTQIALAVA